LQSASADGRQRWLICLDAATGTKRWQQEAPGTRSRMHPRNTLASSTPAADGKHVFAVFWDGQDIQLCAYDYDGKRLWKRDLGGFRSQHGPGLSPVADDGRVFLNNDQDGSARLLAFDVQTGVPLWEAERKAFRTCYSTPLLHPRPGGDKELIVASTAGITGYDPKTGKVKWDFSWVFEGKPLRTVASPVLAGELVVASSGDGDGSRHTIAVRMPGAGQDQAKMVWERLKAVPYVPCMLAFEGHLYSVTDQGVAVCRVAATGEEVWTERLCKAVSASPVLIHGKVYVPAEDGKVYLFAATTTFKRLAANNLGEPIMASPAVADNRLYIRGKQHLFCIAKPSQRSAAR
jgi:outer membrane protein assembly factor BamB